MNAYLATLESNWVFLPLLLVGRISSVEFSLVSFTCSETLGLDVDKDDNDEDDDEDDDDDDDDDVGSSLARIALGGTHDVFEGSGRQRESTPRKGLSVLFTVPHSAQVIYKKKTDN